MFMTEVTLRVEGMACEMCSASVGEALSAVPGVSETHVDLKKKTAVVTHDGSVDDEDLLLAVLNAGFKAKVKHGLFG
jgi:copper chaperone CopZ